MDNTLKFAGALVALVAIGCAAMLFSGVLTHGTSTITPNSAFATGNITVYFFYGEECPHCHAVMPIVANISKKYPDVDVHILEIWHNRNNYDLYLRMSTEVNSPYTGVPIVFVGRTILYGEVQIPQYLEAAVQDAVKKKV